jgi:NAD(P)-dependent dehydrogenase (short-subunit alcohol dehydrogenase family)
MNRPGSLNKVIVVTGAGSGIGAAICRRFGREGWAVGLMDMDGGSVERVGNALAEKGAETLALICDVSDRQACEEAIRRMIRHFGGIDILVNNAGITQRGAFADNRISVYQKVMAVNFFGALYCTKAAMESLLARKGAIVVMESIAGVSPLMGRSGYCASKHALHGLFTTLRCEIRSRGGHVMIVCPGFVNTNLQTRALGADGDIATHRRTTVGRQTTPEQVAAAVYRGVLKRKHLLVLTPMGKIGYWINRLAPHWYERLMERQFRSEIGG